MRQYLDLFHYPWESGEMIEMMEMGGWQLYDKWSPLVRNSRVIGEMVWHTRNILAYQGVVFREKIERAQR